MGQSARAVLARKDLTKVPFIGDSDQIDKFLPERSIVFIDVNQVAANCLNVRF